MHGRNRGYRKHWGNRHHSKSSYLGLKPRQSRGGFVSISLDHQMRIIIMFYKMAINTLLLP